MHLLSCTPGFPSGDAVGARRQERSRARRLMIIRASLSLANLLLLVAALGASQVSARANRSTQQEPQPAAAATAIGPIEPIMQARPKQLRDYNSTHPGARLRHA